MTERSGATAGGARGTLLTYATLGLLQRALSLLLIPFVTRSMTVSDYGAVSVIAAGAALAAVIIGGGVEQAVFRWSVDANRSAEGDAVVRTARTWLFRLCPVLALAAALALWAVPGRILLVPNHIWAVEALAAGLLAPLSYFALPQLRAQRRLRRFVLVSSTSIGTLLIGKVLLVVVLGLGTWGWALSDLLAGIVGYGLATAASSAPIARIGLESVRATWAFAAPLLPHVVSFWALSSLTRPLMATTLPLESIALYSAAYSAAAVGVMVLGEVNRALLPEYAGLDLSAPDPRHMSFIRLQVVAAFVCAGLVLALAPMYGRLILPPEYHSAIEVTGVLSLMSLGYGLYLIPTNIIIQTLGVTTRAWQASSGGTAVVFLLTLPVGLALGPVGVAGVNDLAYVVMAAISTGILLRLVGRPTMTELLRGLRPQSALVVGCAVLFVSVFAGTSNPFGWACVGVGALLCLIGVYRALSAPALRRVTPL